MPADIIMPRLGLTMEEGTVVRWLAREGEHVVQGAPLLEVETDKVIVEVEAPASGVIGTIQVREGEKVPVGALLAHLYAAEEMETRKTEEGTRKIFSSPRARRRAAGLGLDWRTLAGSGPRGRIIERDVLSAAPHLPPPVVGADLSVRPAVGADLSVRPVVGADLSVRPAVGADLSVRPVVGADLSVRPAAGTDLGPPPPASQPAPQLHLSVEVGAGALLEMLARLSPSIEGRAGVQLTTTDLLIRICGAALAQHPRANASWVDGRACPQTQVNVGLAAAAGQAGPVPAVIPDAERPLSQIASERAARVERARREMFTSANVQSSIFDLQSVSFTLVDLGMFRVDRLQAVLSPPQTAILTVGRIAERPAVVDGRLAVRQTAFLTLSCDSRVFDTVLAAQFLDYIVDLIEEPYGLLI